jgi:hypothetical protein
VNASFGAGQLAPDRDATSSLYLVVPAPPVVQVNVTAPAGSVVPSIGATIAAAAGVADPKFAVYTAGDCPAANNRHAGAAGLSLQPRNVAPVFETAHMVSDCPCWNGIVYGGSPVISPNPADVTL